MGILVVGVYQGETDSTWVTATRASQHCQVEGTTYPTFAPGPNRGYNEIVVLYSTPGSANQLQNFARSCCTRTCAATTTHGIGTATATRRNRTPVPHDNSCWKLIVTFMDISRSIFDPVCSSTTYLVKRAVNPADASRNSERQYLTVSR